MRPPTDLRMMSLALAAALALLAGGSDSYWERKDLLRRREAH